MRFKSEKTVQETYNWSCRVCHCCIHYA